MPNDVLRVLTWNVRDLLEDPLAVHRVLRTARPDVACLQEAPRLLLSRNQLAALARHSGMVFVAGGRVSAGTAMLTSMRTRMDGAAASALPVSGWRTRARGYVTATCRLPGTSPVLVAGIHLGLDAGERAQHVRLISGVVAASGLPAVVAGDLNEPPGGPSWQALAAVAGDVGQDSGPTFPAARPRHRIDAVLVSPSLDVVSYGLPDGVGDRDVVLGSDHQPVLAEAVLPRC